MPLICLPNGEWGLLRYDKFGQGLTLRRSGIPSRPITYIDQSQDLEALLNVIGIKGKVSLSTLSYGHAPALVFASLFPERVDQIIAKAPLVKPSAISEAWIRLNTDAGYHYAKKFGVSYETVFNWFSRILLYGVYPFTPQSLDFAAYSGNLEGLFRMTQGASSFDAIRYIKEIPDQSFHLVIANNDQYIDPEVLIDFWQQIPPEKKGTKLILEEAEHNLFNEPKIMGEWTKQVIEHRDTLHSQGIYTIAAEGKFSPKLVTSCHTAFK